MKNLSLLIGAMLQLCVIANAAAWSPLDAQFGDRRQAPECLLPTAAGDDDGNAASRDEYREEEPDCE